jgi:hypothetical protein
MLHHVFSKIVGIGLFYASLLSFLHVGEYLMFLEPGNLFHYNYCMKMPTFVHLREGCSDKVVSIRERIYQ